MLILDRSRALDRMIWTAGRHAVVVPEPFSATSAPAAVPPPASFDEALWPDGAPVLDRGPRRLSAAIELRDAARRAS